LAIGFTWSDAGGKFAFYQCKIPVNRGAAEWENDGTLRLSGYCEKIGRHAKRAPEAARMGSAVPE